MKQYDVYGLGNALVDIEYQVNPDILQALKIDKGVMTLVDQQRQAQIVEHLGSEAHNRSSGGSAANTIIAISQLGGRAFYSCKVADDELGHFYVNDLIDAGVTTNIHPTNMGPGVTGKCLVFVTPDADRTMNTFLGVSAEFSPHEVDTSAVEAADYVYLEGYLVTGQPSLAAAIHACELAQQYNTKVALSLSDPNVVTFFASGLRAVIGDGVDLLFANEEEVKGLTGAQDINAALSQLHTLAAECVITRGARGAIIAPRGEPVIEIAAVTTDAVDTVGAGDMFAGGYLYGITNGMSRSAAGDLASALAAKLVSSFGPRLATLDVQQVARDVSQ